MKAPHSIDGGETVRLAGWEVADGDLEAGLVCEGLQLELPQPGAVAVGVAAVGVDSSVVAFG